MSRIEAFSAVQTLLTVRVTDAVSGRGLPEAQIRLELRSALGPFRDSPIPLSPGGEGWFVMGASPRRIREVFRRKVTTRFRVTVRHPGYAEAEQTLGIARDDFDFIDEDVEVRGETIRRARVSGAPFEMRIALDPHPVRLAGTVLRDMDIGQPLEGVAIAVAGLPGSVTTGASGRFVIPALPLVQVAKLTATRGAESTSLDHPIDYGAPTNTVTLSLKTP